MTLPADENVSMKSRWEEDEDQPPRFSLCAVCKHKTAREATCTAFPGGIPRVFLIAKMDHVSRSWDEPVVFEYYREDMPEDLAKRIKGGI